MRCLMRLSLRSCAAALVMVIAYGCASARAPSEEATAAVERPTSDTHSTYSAPSQRPALEQLAVSVTYRGMRGVIEGVTLDPGETFSAPPVGEGRFATRMTRYQFEVDRVHGTPRPLHGPGDVVSIVVPAAGAEGASGHEDGDEFQLRRGGHYLIWVQTDTGDNSVGGTTGQQVLVHSPANIVEIVDGSIDFLGERVPISTVREALAASASESASSDHDASGN
jgi:hypothetical protein